MKLYSTKDINQARMPSIGDKPLWIFGYGSLIYKVNFPYLESKAGYIHGYERRFWMASQDHRGTPSNPGRVLTICPQKDATCFGMAYLIKPEVLIPLDHREQNGYLREQLNVRSLEGETFTAITYIGDPNAPVYQPQNNNQVLAEQILNSTGPSGPNIDYLFDMANALRRFNQHDEHVFDIERRVKLMQT